MHVLALALSWPWHAFPAHACPWHAIPAHALACHPSTCLGMPSQHMPVYPKSTTTPLYIHSAQKVK
uniref:Secreted protein n=1 Tax=Helianthus annuus TaxID=4232 RepID=A0A251T6D1_HELAN